MPSYTDEDIVLTFQDQILQIEYKRPMNAGTVNGNVEAAIEQISNAKAKALGIVAMDVSKLIGEPRCYLEASSVDSASNYLTDKSGK